MIHTVLGPIEAAELGPTSMHEHLLIDIQVWYHEGDEPPPPQDKVTMASRGYLHWNVLGMRDNLRIDDPDLVTEELRGVAAAGGRGVVDFTLDGIGRRVHDLPAISSASGVHVMVGCGFYIHDVHPEWVHTASVDDIAAHIVGELTSGVGETGIRPALIGEIGTGHPVTYREWRVVRAAGAAGVETGSAVNIHLDSRGQHALEVLDVLLEEGMSADRVILSHMDERPDLPFHREVAQAGAVVEYDTFGSEQYFAGALPKFPTDELRMENLATLIAEGYGDQLTLGCDVFNKTTLKHYGGMGIEHLFLRILPALSSRYGVTERVLHEMTVTTPRRLLDR